MGGEKEEHEVKKADGLGMRMPQPMDSLEQTILLRSKEKKVTRTKSVYRTFLSREAGETLEE